MYPLLMNLARAKRNVQSLLMTTNFVTNTGLLMGASMVALSESERDYYYANRDINMFYVGNKDGMDVYRDNITGQFCKW